MTPTRRQTDHSAIDIESMIMDEDDPKTRAVLVLLNAMNSSLQLNTESTTKLAEGLEAITERINTHEASELAVINKARGVWSVMTAIVGICQIVGASVFAYALHEINTSHDTNIQQEVRIQELTRRLDGIIAP